ncbi:SIS domain-containing protein [Halotia wernerae UHCC 0503]|nr:SIS domain-containing protein [Halotia wernerae UHCC 0503]
MKSESNLSLISTEMIKSMEKVDLTVVGKAIELLCSAYRKGRNVYCIGNGGSASTAAHFAADLGKFATGNKVGFRALDLVSNYSAHTAWTNDSSWENTWVGMLNPWIQEDDILVLFSVNGGNGWSNNLVKAIELSVGRGAKTIGFAGNGGGAFVKLCDVSVIVPTPQSEFITPITEAIHVCIHHIICTEIRRRMNDE